MKGLESVKHSGPSIIDTETLYRSGGEIPEVFLQGTGVTNDLLKFIQKIKKPDCLYTLEQLNTWITGLQERMTIVIRNLDKQQNKAAKFGPLNVPLWLENEIEQLEKNRRDILEEIERWQEFKMIYYSDTSG